MQLDSKLFLLACSALLGMVMGGIFFPSWHHAIESAQSVAGLIDYDQGNPFYIYHRNTWSSLHQILALALAMGFDERSLAFALSGLIGGLSYWTISYLALNLGLSTLSVVLIPVVVHLGRLNDFGPLYPVWIMGSYSSYGIIGLMLSLAAINLVVDRHLFAGGCLLAVSFSVHPLLAAFTVITLLSAAWLSRSQRTIVIDRELATGFLVGAMVTSASFAAFLYMKVHVAVDPYQQKLILEKFTNYWGGHHTKLPLLSTGVALCAIASLFPFIGLRLRNNPLIIVLAVSAGLGLLLGLLSWLPPFLLPDLFESTLPVRFVSFGILFASVAMLTMLFDNNPVLGLVYSAATLWYWRNLHVLDSDASLKLIHVLVLLFLISFKIKSGVRKFISFACALMIGAVIVQLVIFKDSPTYRLAYRFPINNFLLEMKDRTNDEFWSKVSSDGGLLLYSGMDCIQLITRRPVLMASAINQISYVPETGPVINDIMKSVDKLDITNPPDSPFTKTGTLDVRLFIRTWCDRPLEEWKAIGRKYHLTNLLFWDGCKLDLPIEQKYNSFIYYKFPG